MIRALLFLDFDGVLHPYGCEPDRYFCHLALLETWLRRRPALDVVISSTWRDGHPFDELRGYFSPDLRQRILSTTPVWRRGAWDSFDGEPAPVRFEREAEVLRWIQQSDEPWRPWVALDDQAWLFKPFCRQLVVCDGRVGLTQRELDLADTVLAVGH